MQTYVTKGDIRPFIALAKGLYEAGHTVTLAYASPEYFDYSKYFDKTKVRIINASSIECYREEKNLNKFNPEQLGKYFNDFNKYVYSASELLCEENDLVIGNSGAYYLVSYAEKTGTPFVSLSLEHSIIPTKYLPPPGWPGNFGHDYNLYCWYLISEDVNQKNKEYINDFRKTLGLPPVKSVFEEITHSPRLHLIGVSSVFCQQQPDWENHRYVCGYLFPEDLVDHCLVPEDLKNFIKEGESPVFFSLGSPYIFINKREKVINTFIEASKIVGCMAIVQANWDDIDDRLFENSHIYKIGYNISHKYVFPYCSAVVHDGGAGTTHTAILCKCPSVVIEYGVDMRFWGAELNRIGIAPNLLHGDNLNVENLVKEISIVLNSKDMKKKAIIYGELMRKENSVQKITEILESHFNTN